MHHKMKAWGEVTTHSSPWLKQMWKCCALTTYLIGGDGHWHQDLYRCWKINYCIIVMLKRPIHHYMSYPRHLCICSCRTFYQKVGNQSVLYKFLKSCLSWGIFSIWCRWRSILIWYFSINIPGNKQTNKQTNRMFNWEYHWSALIEPASQTI